MRGTGVPLLRPTVESSQRMPRAPYAVMTQADRHSPSLVELRDRAIAGDDRALHQLLCLIHPRITRYLGRCLSGTAAQSHIEDVALDTLIRITEALRSCTARSDGQLMAWVMTTARHLAIDLLRTQYLRFAALELVEEIAEDPASAAGGACDDRPEDEQLLSTIVHRAYSGLAGSTQELLWMRLVEGASWGEIADSMDSTPSAVKRRFQRAQHRLQREVRRQIDGLRRESRDRVVRKLRRFGISDIA